MAIYYGYNPKILKALESAISIPRLDTYLIVANGDLQKAIQLHAWNNALATALFGPVLNIELLLRNKCSYQLTALYERNDWHNAFPNTAGYEYLRNRIEHAKRRLKRLGKNSDYGPQITAHVTFGFWLALFEKHLHRDLWVPALHKIFIYRPTNFNRHEAWTALSEIRDMRNRIAHHEPLLNRDLLSFEFRMLTLASYINPEFADWMKHHSQLAQVWSEKR